MSNRESNSAQHEECTTHGFDPDESHDCEYCGREFYDPEFDTPGPQYMWEGHIIMKCNDVPDDVRRSYNDPTYDGGMNV